MKIFIDFDDVIFNTKQFRVDLKAVFNDNDVNDEIFHEYYYDPQDQRSIKTFNPWLLAERASVAQGFDVKKIKSAVDDFIADISAYVFSDVEKFVKSIGCENIYVVSYGDLEFQRRKIIGSKIETCVKNTFVTDSLKSITVGNIIKREKWSSDERIFFIDDRVEQLEDIKCAFPAIKTILIKRPDGRYQDQVRSALCDFEAENLVAVMEIINESNCNK